MSILKRNQSPPGKQPAQVAGKQPVAPRTESTVRPISPSPVVPAPEPVGASPVVPTPEPVAASPARPPTPPVNREAAAILDRNTDLNGTLHSQGNVLVEGCFEGELEAKETIWVEEGARTKGQLRSKDAVISGSSDGQVDCQHRLQITKSASVSGQIKTPVLVIEEGATINCRFSMARSER